MINNNDKLRRLHAYLVAKDVDVLSIEQDPSGAVKIVSNVGETSGRKENFLKTQVNQFVTNLFLKAVQLKLLVKATDFIPSLTTDKDDRSKNNQLARLEGQYGFRIPSNVMANLEKLLDLPEPSTTLEVLPKRSSAAFFGTRTTPPVAVPPVVSTPSASTESVRLPVGDSTTPSTGYPGAPGGLQEGPQQAVMGKGMGFFDQSNVPKVRPVVRPKRTETAPSVDTAKTQQASTEQEAVVRPQVTIRHG